MLKCLVPSCNKKYRSEKKRQEHVEKIHFYQTINSNNCKFSNSIRAQIYDLASTYIETLYEIRENKHCGKGRKKLTSFNQLYFFRNLLSKKEKMYALIRKLGRFG